MNTFESSVQAFEAARRRSSVARSFEESLLHEAIYDAREAGMSVRETAAALRVPKSNVARHWQPHHQCDQATPIFGSPDEWLAAERAVWAHNPSAITGHVPYAWERNEDGTMTIRLRHTGVAKAE